MYPSGSQRDFVTVGMPDAAVKESRERIKSALLNSGFGYPSKSIGKGKKNRKPLSEIAFREKWGQAY